MSRHTKTFSPRVTKAPEQTPDNGQEEKIKYEPITDQDAKTAMAKADISGLHYKPFQNLAFKKIESGRSVIKFSDKGPHVLELKKALTALGYKVSGKGNLFWEDTKYTLIAFQRDHKLKASAVFDATTLMSMDAVLANTGDEKSSTVPQQGGNKKKGVAESEKGKTKPQTVNEMVYQSPPKTDPAKLFKCDPALANDYCLTVSFTASKSIPKGDTTEGYAVYYQGVYGGTEDKATTVAESWGRGNRITFSNEIKAGTLVTVTVPLEKYLNNILFDAPENDIAREALKQRLLAIASDDKDGKKLDREGLNEFLTDEYSKITEDKDYVAIKDKLKGIKEPELSAAGKKAALTLEKDPENKIAKETLITEFEKFGQEMAIYMLQINRKLIVTEAERHGIWQPYGEQKDKLQELKTDIQVYKLQMATIQANLPSYNEQMKLRKEADYAIGQGGYGGTQIYDEKIEQAEGYGKQYAARNDLYATSPILSIGDDFNTKGMQAGKQDWATDWEHFDLKSDKNIIAELEGSIIVQLEKIDEAEENIRKEDPDFIWDLNEIIPVSIQQAGIAGNKNAVKVIKDKVRSEARYKLIKNIFLIAGGIVLSIVSLGEATPFLLAVLAGGGAMAISGYYLKKDIHDYKLNQSLYDASLQFGQVLKEDDPTMIWIGLSLLGMLGDTAQVIRILKAARATNTVYKTIITLSKAEGLTDKEAAILNEMIENATNINKIYTSDEIIQLASTADRLGISSTELLHHIFIGGRANKPISAMELMQQMKNWKQIIKPRGYSFRFNSKAEFEEFSKFLIQNLKGTKVPVYDIRVQGSALRNPNAKDVDLVSMVTKDDFADCLIQAFNGKMKTVTGETVEIAGKSFHDLENLANNIHTNQNLYNAISETFMKAVQQGKISSKSAKNINTSFLKDFRDARIKVAAKYPDLNIEDIVIQPIGGNFDLEPYFKLTENGSIAFDIMDIVPLGKSGKALQQIEKQDERK